MEYTRQEEIIELLKTKSNQFFSENEEFLRDSVESGCYFLDDADEDGELTQDELDPETLFKFILNNCMANMHEEFRWYVEDTVTNHWYENKETIE